MSAVEEIMQREIERLRAQLHLAEVVRAAQVEGLTQGAAGWRERANQLEAEVAGLRGDAARYLYLREKCPWTVCVDGDDGRTATVSLHIKVSKDLMVADGEDDFDAAIDAALAALAARKGEA